MRQNGKELLQAVKSKKQNVEWRKPRNYVKNDSEFIAHTPVQYFVYFLEAARVHTPAGCKQTLAEAAYPLMKREQRDRASDTL